MKAIELYEIATATAKAGIGVTNPIQQAESVVAAAQSNNVDPADFNLFQQYVGQARQQYARVLAVTLPSETIAALAAKKAAIAPAAPTPAAV